MENYQESDIPQSERFMALLCHFIGGFLFSVIIFFVNKKSKFLRFHALQSIIFTSPLILFSIYSYYLMFFSVDASQQFIEDNPFLSILVLPLGFLVLCITLLSFNVGIAAFRGERKKYPLVGKWAYKKVYGIDKESEVFKLNISETNSPSSDERLMAFISYISALTTGFIVLVFIYYAYKRKSNFIAFNTLQIIYGYLALFIFVYIPYQVLSSIFEWNEKINYPDSTIVNSILSGGINSMILSLVGIAFLFLSLKTLKGKIVKFPVFGNLAYNKIYNTADKSSFNLTDQSPPPPIEKRSSKEMI